MDARTIEAIKADFAEWTGGFPPESEQQISVYLENSLPTEFDFDEAREVLLGWTCDQRAPDSS